MSISSTFLDRWRAEREEQRRREQTAAQQIDRIRQQREQERQRRAREEALQAQTRAELLTRKQREQEQKSRAEEQQRTLQMLSLQSRREEQRQETARIQQKEVLRADAARKAQQRTPRPPLPRVPERVEKLASRAAPREKRPNPQPLTRQYKERPSRDKQTAEPHQGRALSVPRPKQVGASLKENFEAVRRRVEESARQRKLTARAKELQRRSEFRLPRPDLPIPTTEALPSRPALPRASAPATRSGVGTGKTNAPPPFVPGAEDMTLSGLSTRAGFVVNENGDAVYLRGVTVAGLDKAVPAPQQTLAQALALDDSGLSVLSEGWGVNLIRIPFTANSVLSGTATLTAKDLLAGLDDLIAQLEEVGCYVLLALEPAHESNGILPADGDYICMQRLAIRYRDEPTVLYEPFASKSALARNWLGIALAVIGTIRREHPGSLLFIGNGTGTAAVDRLPLTYGTGDPISNLVYTIRLTPQLMNTVDRATLQALSQNYPVFVSQWSDSGADFGRSSELAADLLERFAAGWAASSWNADPRLVVNALAHQYSATRWGSQVQRTLAQPVRPLLMAFDERTQAF